MAFVDDLSTIPSQQVSYYPEYDFPEGSREWMLSKVDYTGLLKEPHPDQHLDMRDQGIPLKELREMCGELGTDPDLRSLDLSGNLIGVMQEEEHFGAPPQRPPDGHQFGIMPGVATVAEALSKNQHLTQIDLSRNSLGDYGQGNLLSIQKSLMDKDSLRVLDLSSNGILGPDGMRFSSLAHFSKHLMPSLPNMMHLTLSYNELHSEAAKLLSSAIAVHVVPNLLVLDLGCNRISEDPRGDYDASGVLSLCQALRAHIGLNSLNLRDNRLSNYDTAAIMKCAAGMLKLVSLDISENIISASGVTSIQEQLYTDDHLLHLNLNGCPLNDGRGSSKYAGGGFTSLASLLNLNRTLTHLELAGTGFDDEACKAFEKALLANPVLIKLDVYSNDEVLSPLRTIAIRETVDVNQELLNITHNPTTYNYSAKNPFCRKHLLLKIHHLDPRVLKKLLKNKTFFDDDTNMRKRLQELLPPSRKKLLRR